MKKQTKEQRLHPCNLPTKRNCFYCEKEILGLPVCDKCREKYTFSYQQAQKDDKLKIDKLQLALNIEREWSERLKKELLLQKQWSEATVKEAKKRGIKEFYTYPLIVNCKKIKGVN